MKKLINDERREKEQALREQQEAIRVAQSILEENKKLKGSLTSGEKVLVDNVKVSAARDLEVAKKAYKDAGFEIEVIDDRPEEDQKNATPLPKEIVYASRYL